MRNKIAVLMVLLIVLYPAIATSGLAVARNSVSVTGELVSNTTWESSNSYSLTGNLLVTNGVTLTIEAGADVNLNGWYIMIEGTLITKSNDKDRVNFDNGRLIFADSSADWDEETGAGPIIKNAYINETFIELRSASPKITESLIDMGGIIVQNGSPVISNNDFDPGSIAVKGGTPVIFGNNIYGSFSNGREVLFFTPIAVTGGAPIISKNNIRHVTVGIDASFGSPYISDNNVTFCSPNIIANKGTIERNYFDGYIKIGNVTARNNTITSIEVQGYSSPTIHYNNLQSLRLSSATNVDAANNWWGTTDSAKIDTVIWDYANDFELGRVNYAPFLTEANPYAIPNSNVVLSEVLVSPSPTEDRLVAGESFFGLSWLGVSVIVIALVVLLISTVVFLQRNTDRKLFFY